MMMVMVMTKCYQSHPPSLRNRYILRLPIKSLNLYAVLVTQLIYMARERNFCSKLRRITQNK